MNDLIQSAPERWSVKRLRFVTNRIEQGWSPQCDNRIAEGDEWAVMKVGCVNGDRFDASENKALPAGMEIKREYELRPKEVLVSRANTKELLGSAAIVPDDVRPRLLLCDKLFRVKPSSEVDGRFLTYFLRTSVARYQYEREATGTSGSMQNIGQDTLKNVLVPLPDLDEQTAIVAFLDWKTGQIDALIVKKCELIEKLKEKRLSVITQAVTKGLNPNAPLRDSGIPWIGTVPEHWEVKKLSRVTASRCDGPFGSGLKSEHYVDDGIRVIRLQNIGFAEFDGEDQAFIDPDYYDGLGDHDVFPGDLLVAGLGDKNNPVGRACRAPADLGAAMVKADCFRYRLEATKADSNFMAYQMSVTAGALSGALASGVTRPRMNLSLTSGRVLAFPPVAEQIEIATHIDAARESMQKVIDGIESAMTRLTEYRTAMITAATTGKIDVRNIDVPAQV